MLFLNSYFNNGKNWCLCIPLICIFLITSEGYNVYTVHPPGRIVFLFFLPIASPLTSQVKTVQPGEFKWPVQGHIASDWKGQGQNSHYGPPCRLFHPAALDWAPSTLTPHPIPPPRRNWKPQSSQTVQGKERTGQAAPWRKHPDINYSWQKALESLLMNSRQLLTHTLK